MYYEYTIAKARIAIAERFPGTMPVRHELRAGSPTPPEHLVWMLDQVALMPIDSIETATKAARWIGYILCALELYEVWQNTDSRDYVRTDVHNGSTVPRKSP